MSVLHVPSLWSLDVIGIHDPIEHKSRKEKDLVAMNNALNTITRNSDGRYSMKLPWISNRQLMPKNFLPAKSILESVTKSKLNTPALFHLVNSVIQQWLQEGYIEIVPEDDKSESVHYLPHHPVFKPSSSTTPVRPVFNASFKSGRSPSLNMMLETGPNLLELIPAVLLRFREKAVGVAADIKQAFLQIEIEESDRDFLRFLWWSDAQKTKMVTYRHKRVVFGVTCSPFMLMLTIHHHLSQVPPSEKAVAESLKQALYVDNCVTSVNNYQEYESFKNNSTNILRRAKMELRMWEHTLKKGEKNEGSIVSSVLGLEWNRESDTLSCVIPSSTIQNTLTQRGLASDVQKIYDPLGVLCPALLIPKLLLRKAWKEGKSWSKEVSESVRKEYFEWKKEAYTLHSAKINRHFTQHEYQNLQIHTFCDASSQAYAAVSFIRAEDQHGVSTQFLMAKNRLAPQQNVSIPRLELLAALIGVRLTKTVHEALNYSHVPTFYWTDSTNVLAWLKRNDKWGTFVGNRVKEILGHTTPESFRYVPSELNPADLPSRGCSPSKLVEKAWWEGPSWLQESPECWPQQFPEYNENEVNRERKKINIVAQNVSTSHSHRFLKFDNHHKNLVMVAFILKWRKENSTLDFCSLLEKAETTLCRLVQRESFPQNSSIINDFEVVVDDQGLYRVKTKLFYRDDTENFRFPILLPENHLLSSSILRFEHNFTCAHAGLPMVLSRVREKFIILKARKTLKSIIKNCVICQKFKSKPGATPTIPLPKDRVQGGKPFLICGVDLGGYLILRDGTKVWFVLFTCAVYRAIHLELVDSLSTNTFLLALSRFITRKGRVSTIYSDTATNFTGANNLFETLDWKFIQKETLVKRIKWKFNPPATPWWGGFYERLIGSVKAILRRTLGNRRLNYVELETMLCETEAIINSRPLTYVGEETEDLIPLTPAAFLIPNTQTNFPELDLVDSTWIQRQFKQLGMLRDELEMRFRSEYLGLLVQRRPIKNTSNLAIGDIVLVELPNKKRQLWPMGRVTEVIQGKDNAIRLAKVQLQHHYDVKRDEAGKYQLVKISLGSILLRPVQKLYHLELNHTSTNPLDKRVRQKMTTEFISDISGQVTRFGRRVVKPDRLSY